MAESFLNHDWIDAQQAMDLLHCGPRSLARRRQEGVIRHNGTGTRGKDILYDKKSILRYLQNPSKQRVK